MHYTPVLVKTQMQFKSFRAARLYSESLRTVYRIAMVGTMILVVGTF